jgi:phosphohistidine phosphatase
MHRHPLPNLDRIAGSDWRRAGPDPAHRFDMVPNPMKSLYIVRHAKAGHRTGTADFDRPLAPHGRAAAALIGAYMRDRNLIPDLILSSSAKRTMQTAALLVKQLGAIPVEQRRTLYLAAPTALFRAICDSDDAVVSLALVGHNPGLHHLATVLADPGATDPGLLAAMREKMPTAALAVLRFEADRWAAVTVGQGRLEAFVTPRDLGGSAED